MFQYIKLYHQEEYIFDTIHNKFHKDGKLSAFDFFYIIIWKANRAKSYIAKNLLENDNKNRKDLNAIVEDLTNTIFNAKSDKDRMSILIKNWKFRLPTASAILTVLYPDNFTIYDIRVCNVLQDYYNIQDKKDFSELWKGYENFVDKVKQKAPSELSLRDKDRYLWGQSFEEDLNKDIKDLFAKEVKDSESKKL